MDSNRTLTRVLLAALAALLLFPLLAMLFAGPTMGTWGGMGSGMGGMGGAWGMGSTWGMGGGWLLSLWLLLLVLVVGAAVVAFGLGGDGEEDDGALAELRESYARGDLTDEEYEQRRDRLQRDS